MTTINAFSTAHLTATISTNGNAQLGGVLSTQLGAAVSNVITQAVGTAVNQAAQQLNQQAGMPQFLVNEIGNITNAAVKGLAQNASPAATGAVQNATQGPLEAFIKNLTKSIVDAVKAQQQQGSDGENGGGTKPSSGGKSSGSWMQAIAQAMGEAMGKKAARMVELAAKIQALSEESANNSNATDSDKMKAASETQRLNTEFQATGQEFNLLQTTFSTAIKTIGEGMASVARKQ